MKLPPDALSLLIVLGIVIGIVQCFFGYRIFKIVLGLTGFIVGGALTGGLAHGYSMEPAVAVVIGLVGGLIGAVLMVVLYFVGIFVFGGLLGAVVGAAAFAAAQTNPEPIVLIILGVVCGVVALFFQKLMIILSTAFGGAWSVVLGIAQIALGNNDPINLDRLIRPGASHRTVIVICWLILGFFGLVFQYRAAALAKKEKDSK